MMCRTVGVPICVLLLALLPVGGCATSQGRLDPKPIGAIVGGALGGGLCAVAGGEPILCTVAGLGGAAVGWGVTAVIEEATQRSEGYGTAVAETHYRPEQGLRVDLDRAAVSPGRAAPGENLDVTAHYWVLAPESGRAVPVTLTASVWQDGEKLREVFTETLQQVPGGYDVRRSFPVASDAPPGAYELRFEVTAPDAHGERAMPLVVAAN